MTKEDVLALQSEDVPEQIRGASVGEIAGHLVINGKIPMPIKAVECSLSPDLDLEIVDDQGITLGTLCFCRHLLEIEIAQLTEWQLAAYLSEASLAELNQPYRFRSDFLVVEEAQYERYNRELRHSSPIWGGFYHFSDADQARRRYLKRPAKLVAVPGITIPTRFHELALRKAVGAADSYDRFLKLYHELELLFDWVVVRKIQGLDKDLLGIGRLLSDYGSHDLVRLKHLLSSYVIDTPALFERLRGVLKYKDAAFLVFQMHGKDGNPLKERWDKFWAFLDGGTLSLAEAKKHSLANNQTSLEELLKVVAAYWIFRIRSCIAHNRIGEYILGEDEEEFVVEFGESLLREALSQVLRNPEIRAFSSIP